jgi:hypothetical protein
MSETPFKPKGKMKFPPVVFIVGGVAALFIVMKLKKGKAAPVSTTAKPRMSGNNGNGAVPSIFFLPQGTPNPSQVTVNVPARDHRRTHHPHPVPEHEHEGKHDKHEHEGKRHDHHKPHEPMFHATAQPSHSLAGIEQHFGTPVGGLVSANQISNPNLIYPGQ